MFRLKEIFGFNSLIFWVIFHISIFSYSQENFKIEINRQNYLDTCIEGYLSINDKIICYSLELPFLDNEKNISSIPVGDYNGILRYDHSDKWRIELIGTAPREWIQIHIGNYTNEISGCILVGESVNNCTISNSKKAYGQIKEYFYGSRTPILTPDKIITIKISE